MCVCYFFVFFLAPVSGFVCDSFLAIASSDGRFIVSTLPCFNNNYTTPPIGYHRPSASPAPSSHFCSHYEFLSIPPHWRYKSSVDRTVPYFLWRFGVFFCSFLFTCPPFSYSPQMSLDSCLPRILFRGDDWLMNSVVIDFSWLFLSALVSPSIHRFLFSSFLPLQSYLFPKTHTHTHTHARIMEQKKSQKWKNHTPSPYRQHFIWLFFFPTISYWGFFSRWTADLWNDDFSMSLLHEAFGRQRAA